ncbi:S8 family serine peptidase [Dokdonella koreensis]|uniref:Subtilase family n=1 Tax=Dokdonella koreensis DS-123 TaxID=1300342 RepID=A0A160DTX3_9GAMM|nr:S8 family serine peptidase [Dokdonella koreensis]ANB17855.1 Subtilase family [Dokdonella koreensis DS-123]
MQTIHVTRLAAALGLILTTAAAASAAPASAIGAGLAAGTVAGTAGSGIISFGDLRFDPRHGVPGDDGSYRSESDGRGLRFVQFGRAIQGQWLDELAATGIRPLQYYPDNTYLVWAEAAAVARFASHPQVRWQGNYLPAWKIAPDLAKRSGAIRNVGVFFYNDGDVDAVLAALGQAGATVVNHGPAQTDGVFHNAWIEADAAQLQALAALPQVIWLEHASPAAILDDEMSDQISARNYGSGNVPVTGYAPWLDLIGYRGTGVTWAVIDSGVDLTHPDLASRIAGGKTYPGCPAGNGPGDDNTSGGHGTHVAGIIAGTAATGLTDAQGFLFGLGMAPGVRIFAQNPICTGSVPWPPTGGWQVLSKDALLGGATGGNGSWTSGESGGTSYTAAARTWDQIIRDGNFDTPAAEPFVMVFSAGNSGPGAGTLTAPKAAKNPIVTASSRNYRVGDIDAISSFSSRGPTNDGRFGPTIATPGEQIASARRVAGAAQCATAIAGTSNQYAYCSGTSMASPHAAGAAALLTEWWRDTNSGATPSPAMIKALLINGAKPVGSASIPNTSFGWGRVDLPGSMGLDYAASTYVDQSQVLTSVGQSWQAIYGVPDTSKPLRISLAWTDAAAATGANPALVNNLDLEVETGGQLYRGNVIANNVSTTGGAADTRNNTEGVIIANPGGSVTVRVIATNLPGDGVPGGSATDQDFALVCRNCAYEAAFTLTASPAQQAVCAPANAQYAIDIGSILGYATPVALSVSGQPAGTTATFSQPSVTPPGSATLTIGNTGAAAAGGATLTIAASNVDRTSTVERGLLIATAAPASPQLVAPADQAVGQTLLPTLIWQASPQAAAYRLEIATDAAFGTVILDETVEDTQYTPAAALASATTYYWRITPDNVCGTGTASAVYRFRTAAAPGQCDFDQTTTMLFEEAFTAGAGGFVTTGGSGASNWALSTQRPSPLSGGNAFKATDVATVTDQRLTSPVIALPAGQSPITLRYQNWRALEPVAATTTCYDAGILEIAVDGGAFTQVTGARLINDPYVAPVSTSWGSPLAGLDGWCGTRAYADTLIDLSEWADRSVQLRWRLGTDQSAAADAWYVDDIRIEGCSSRGEGIFTDGFEVLP